MIFEYFHTFFSLTYLAETYIGILLHVSYIYRQQVFTFLIIDFH